MGQSNRVFPSLLLLLVITATILSSNYPIRVNADYDMCPYKCRDAVTEPVCGDKDGQKITYRNKCWLDCRGYYYTSLLTNNEYLILLVNSD